VSLKDFFEAIDDEVSSVLDSSFEIEIIDTKFVPNFDDPNITYDNLDTKKKKCKRLESCVLYVDIRDSVKLSAEKQPKTLAKVYSSFVRSMIACARYYDGHVRNIIGDRVMVVFDQHDCFKKAVDTATLMNSVCQHILNVHIKSTEFKCGIGIDYGKMLITKGGAIRQGSEKEFYRSLVWLGKPANIASRLTDLAHKTESFDTPAIHQGNYYPFTAVWNWESKPYEQFINELESTNSRMLKHKEEYFYTFFKTTITNTKSHSPILMTKAVYDGLKKEHPNCAYIEKDLFRKKEITVRDYSGDVYGGDAYFPDVKEI
jgi:adenylate cyclase